MGAKASRCCAFEKRPKRKLEGEWTPPALAAVHCGFHGYLGNLRKTHSWAANCVEWLPLWSVSLYGRETWDTCHFHTRKRREERCCDVRPDVVRKSRKRNEGKDECRVVQLDDNRHLVAVERQLRSISTARANQFDFFSVLLFPFWWRKVVRHFLVVRLSMNSPRSSNR